MRMFSHSARSCGEPSKSLAFVSTASKRRSSHFSKLLRFEPVEYPYRTGTMEATTLHIYPMPQHLVEASYTYLVADGVFGILRCIRSQFPGYGFPYPLRALRVR